MPVEPKIPPCLFCQNFAHFLEIGVFHIAGNIDFADAKRNGFRNFRIRISRAAVQHQRNRQTPGDIAQNVHLQLRLHPLRIDTVRGANRYRQRIHAGTGDKIFRLRRVGIGDF